MLRGSLCRLSPRGKQPVHPISRRSSIYQLNRRVACKSAKSVRRCARFAALIVSATAETVALLRDAIRNSYTQPNLNVYGRGRSIPELIRAWLAAFPGGRTGLRHYSDPRHSGPHSPHASSPARGRDTRCRLGRVDLDQDRLHRSTPSCDCGNCATSSAQQGLPRDRIGADIGPRSNIDRGFCRRLGGKRIECDA